MKSTTKIPVINVGSEVPTSTNTELARSANFPFLRAAKIPSDTPTEIHKIKAPKAKLNVTGNALPIIVVTHSWRE